jgi:hypothetical protein
VGLAKHNPSFEYSDPDKPSRESLIPTQRGSSMSNNFFEKKVWFIWPVADHLRGDYKQSTSVWRVWLPLESTAVATTANG